ncbi:uncharacterized protein K460DRAFT_297172 [Cucurbitaria berberidis CBS 394.84]|uniref:Uncharacterized protein n=1 Tax=Cucurbitaria berberidis CBS 394.84 TaxID=1168544 RepID=A0A9P4L3Z4_9PLEO|nr:uncharacterized protein K460DRAFT_297172 [Cucurbitaria berberidis CBS 394.84]KAF1840323.1 hypothetical protein K460DRAFT_297172 [Cucurbitaria berberidis CBS 394.84]
MMSLVPTRKRRDIHNPALASRDKDKVRLIEKSTEHLLNASAKPQVRTSLPASRTFKTLRRGSIKIFSIFRNGKNSTPGSRHAASGDSGSALRASESTQRAATATTSDTYTESTLHCPSLPSISAVLPGLTLHQRGSSSLQLTNFDGESEPILSSRSPLPTALHRSRSTPGLSRQLTSKFSNALLHNATVIHRPKKSSRPTIRSGDFERHPSEQPAVTVTSPQPPMSDVSSLPSSFLGSSNAPLSQSTVPTSLLSSGAPISAETTHRVHNESRHISTGCSPPLCEPATEQMPPHFLVFPRQDAPRLSEPSVATIERAAAAKVFFESHFNQLLATKVSPRSMRRRKVEHKLFALALPNDQRHLKRRE